MTDEDRWIRRFVPAQDAASRLVCLPHAGGAASYYLPVAKALAPKVDVLVLQYPGRQDRCDEPGLESVAELADGAFEALRPWTGRPLTLFGHSMGASVAFELALRLQDAGVELTGLFVSSRRAPSRTRADEHVHLLDDAGLIAEVKALAGAGSHLLDDKDIMRMVLPSIRSDYRATETYRWTPGPKLACPIFSFVGDADPKVDADEVRAWGEHTAGKFEFQVFSGGHFFIDEHTPAVIAAIVEHVDQAVR